MKHVYDYNIGFDSALNVEKKFKYKEEGENKNVQEQPKEAETSEVTTHEIYYKKKKMPLINETKEEILEIPTNALSYLEYKQIQKERNKEGDKKVNQVKVNETDALPKVINENEFILGTAEDKKKVKKMKEKPSDNKEQDLSHVIPSVLDEREYPRREKRYYSDRKIEKKFHFKPEDFPELK